MCTLVLGFQVDRRWPLLVAANRDERLDRPSEGWALRTLRTGQGDGPPVVAAAPLDLQAGGTWVGVASGGRFAGVTNHYVRFDGRPDPSRRSRGSLVPLALGARSAAEAARRLAGLDAGEWNPFHLVIADAAGAFLWWYDGVEQGLEALEPGLHVVTEVDREGRGARAERIRSAWPADPSLGRLRELLARHGAPPPAGDATCIHGDPLYGTRSSAILRLTPDLSTSELFVAEGRPCVTPHEDRSELLVALSRRT
ncbi:MAG TPA: NRDE family protein [Anaeromyxobacter sp.]|nr:NRDE family protein [Anaeromyxobacter sp.]